MIFRPEQVNCYILKSRCWILPCKIHSKCKNIDKQYPHPHSCSIQTTQTGILQCVLVYGRWWIDSKQCLNPKRVWIDTCENNNNLQPYLVVCIKLKNIIVARGRKTIDMFIKGWCDVTPSALPSLLQCRNVLSFGKHREPTKMSSLGDVGRKLLEIKARQKRSGLT